MPSPSRCGCANSLANYINPPSRATVVYCDNISAVYMSSNPVQHQRTKHIEIDLHFVRERVALGEIRVLHVPTSSQFADIFTKGLPTLIFLDFRSSLNVDEPHVSPTGGVGMPLRHVPQLANSTTASPGAPTGMHCVRAYPCMLGGLPAHAVVSHMISLLSLFTVSVYKCTLES